MKVGRVPTTLMPCGNVFLFDALLRSSTRLVPCPPGTEFALNGPPGRKLIGHRRVLRSLAQTGRPSSDKRINSKNFGGVLHRESTKNVLIM